MKLSKLKKIIREELINHWRHNVATSDNDPYSYEDYPGVDVDIYADTYGGGHLVTINCEFDELWKALWGERVGLQYKNEEKMSQEKFKTLKLGINNGTNEFNLKDLVKSSETKWEEPEWGFPKGRRNNLENDLNCALREFEEELGISRTTVSLMGRLDDVITKTKFLVTPFVGRMKSKHIYSINTHEVDEILGLRVGADDYVKKPFSQQLLLQRIRSLLRRHDRSGVLLDGADNEPPIVRGNLKLDTGRHLCSWKGDAVKLTITEFLILKTLAARPGIFKNRNQLMDAALGEDIYVNDRTIDSHIKRIRKKFKVVDSDFDPIETLYGGGYRYREE